MVISCFERTGAAEMSEIKKESRIHLECGGRFIIPWMLAALLTALVFILFGFWWCLGALICSVSMITLGDRFWGIGSLPIFGYLSYLLQKHITTAEPGVKELLTAQRAMQEIIKSHQSPSLSISLPP